MGRLRLVFAAFVLALTAHWASAQNSSVLLMDADAVYQRSVFAAFLRQPLEDRRVALAQENADLVAELEAEELALTEQRPTMVPADFQDAARAFDEKAKRTRQEQDRKELDIQQGLATVRRQFFVQIQPVVAEIMQERGASLVLENSSVLYGLPSVNITDAAIARIDAAFARAQASQQNQPAETSTDP